MLTVTGDGIEDRVEFVLEDENITHIVISSYNNGSLAFTQVELALQFQQWSVSNIWWWKTQLNFLVSEPGCMCNSIIVIGGVPTASSHPQSEYQDFAPSGGNATIQWVQY